MTERPDEEGRVETGSVSDSGSAGDVTPPVAPVGLPPGGPGSLGGLRGSRAGGFGPGAGTEAGLRAGPPPGSLGPGGAMGAGGRGGAGAGQFVVPHSSRPPLTAGMRINAQLDKSVGYPLPWDTEDDHVVRDVLGDGLSVSPPVIGED